MEGGKKGIYNRDVKIWEKKKKKKKKNRRDIKFFSGTLGK